MKYLDLTFPTPAENLACDEALLDGCEAGEGSRDCKTGPRTVPGRSKHGFSDAPETQLDTRHVQSAAGGDRLRSEEGILRFWESPEYFIVTGYANRVATEVNVAACEANGIPIYRRCSGGGTVLQGPGCLNYALILKIEEYGPLHNITTANRFIMERNRKAIETLLSNSDLRFPISDLQVCGHTDLAIGGRKFSGNSQRRRKHFLLFHGTFLLNFDLALVSEYLRMPSRQPEYRRHRAHAEFLTNLNAPAGEIKAALRQVWSAEAELKAPPLEAIRRLAAQKYSTDAWNRKI